MKKSLIPIFIMGLLLVNTIGFADETNQMNEGKEIMKDNKISLGTEIKPMTPVSRSQFFRLFNVRSANMFSHYISCELLKPGIIPPP